MPRERGSTDSELSVVQCLSREGKEAEADEKK